MSRYTLFTLVAVIAALTVLATPSQALVRNYAWDAPLAFEDGSAIDVALTYRVFEVGAGTNLTLLATTGLLIASIDQTAVKHKMVVTATTPDGFESDRSNILIDDLRKPKPPGLFRRIVASLLSWLGIGRNMNLRVIG